MQALDEVAELLRGLGIDLAVDAENAAVYFRVWPEQGGSPQWENTADTFVVHSLEEYWISIEAFPAFVAERGSISKELACALLGLNDISKMAKFAIIQDGPTVTFTSDLRREDLNEGSLMDTIQVMRHILRERLPSLQKEYGLTRLAAE